MFENIWFPKKEEILKWAYDNESSIPCQDWELALFSEGSFENVKLLCSFIEDRKCKKKDFFLGVLYVLTGDTVTSENKEAINKLYNLLNDLKGNYQSQTIIQWINRSEKLINFPKLYSYKFWGLDSSYVY